MIYISRGWWNTTIKQRVPQWKWKLFSAKLTSNWIMYFKKITTEIRIRTQNHQKHARVTRDAQKLNEYSTNLFSFFHFSEKNFSRNTWKSTTYYTFLIIFALLFILFSTYLRSACFAIQSTVKITSKKIVRKFMFSLF